MHLELARVDDGGLDAAADGAGLAATLLDVLDGLHRLLIGDLAKDDVLAIEPAGFFCGDEELGAVAIEGNVLVYRIGSQKSQDR